MEFRTFCDNEGCRKEMSPVVSADASKAFCTECGKEIGTVNVFMRRQLVAFGHVKRAEKKKAAWSFKCLKCQKEGPPQLGKNNELACCYCGEELTNVSKPFAQMIKVNLNAQKRSESK